MQSVGLCTNTTSRSDRTKPQRSRTRQVSFQRLTGVQVTDCIYSYDSKASTQISAAGATTVQLWGAKRLDSTLSGACAVLCCEYV